MRPMGRGTTERNALALSQSVLDEIIDHCRKGYPWEACGIVGGRPGRAEQVYPMTNVHPDPARHYSMHPEELIAAMGDMRTAGQQLVAIFHSHPDTPAYPSETDIDLAYYPDAYYIIVSMARESPDVQAFRIDWHQRTVQGSALHIRDK